MSGRGDAELKDELGAAVEVQQELGSSYDKEVIDSFVEKLDQRIDGAVDKRVRRRLAEQQLVVGGERSSSQGAGGSPGPAFGLAAGSLVLAIPLSAIAAVNTGLVGLAVVMAGIVGINACYAASVNGGWGRRRATSDSWD